MFKHYIAMNIISQNHIISNQEFEIFVIFRQWIFMQNLYEYTIFFCMPFA